MLQYFNVVLLQRFFIPLVGALIYLSLYEDDKMMTKWGLLAKKQEMTRLWVEWKQVPVTLLKIIPQEIIRHKTMGKDGYDALVLGTEKAKKGKSNTYAYICEIKVVAKSLEIYAVGSPLTASSLDEVSVVRVMWVSKGKGFQWVMKRHNFSGGPATHGSKFHRVWWSTGNRKPRRTIRGWKMAGRMGNDKVTLRSVPIVDRWEHEGEQFVALKWSVPGAYHSYVTLMIS